MNLIQPFESFARAIFGVLQMEELVATADKARAPFDAVRDHFYDRLPALGQEGLLAMARYMDGLPRVSQVMPQAEARECIRSIREALIPDIVPACSGAHIVEVDDDH